VIRRGDVVWVDLDPVRGSESNQRRPAVVVSNDGANRTASTMGRGVVTVVPVTSNTDRVYGFQVLLPARTCGLSQDSKAQAEQVRAISVERVGEVVGQLPSELAEQLDDALRLHLSL
jgi:mRNA interferase MazF